MNEKNYKLNLLKIIKSLKNARECKFYNDLLMNVNLNQNISYDEFCKIPMTTKKDYKEHSFDFINNAVYKKGFSKEKYLELSTDILVADEYLKKYDLKLRTTSGSTGVPMDIFVHKIDLMSAFLNLNKMRNLWYPRFFNEQYIWIWFNNQLHYRLKNETEPLKKESGYQYFVKEASEEELFKIYSFICNNNIKWMVCHPSFIYLYSTFLKKNGLTDYTLEYVECQCEKLYDWQIESLRDTMQAKISNVYSSNEIHFIGMTCEKNIMHTISNNAFVEIVDDEVVVTNLSAKYMPLIRYKIGDVGKWYEKHNHCDLLQGMPFELTGYRSNDSIVLKNGTKISYFVISESITNLRHYFKIDFDQYAVNQELYDMFLYRIYLKKDYDTILGKKDSLEKYLSSFLSKIIGSHVYVRIILSQEPIYSNSEKFRYFKCDVNKIGGNSIIFHN